MSQNRLHDISKLARDDVSPASIQRRVLFIIPTAERGRSVTGDVADRLGRGYNLLNRFSCEILVNTSCEAVSMVCCSVS